MLGGYKFILYAIFAVLYTSPTFANRLAQCRICFRRTGESDPCSHCNLYLDNRDPNPTRHQVKSVSRCYAHNEYKTEGEVEVGGEVQQVCHRLNMCEYYGHHCLEGIECIDCERDGIKNYSHYHKQQAIALECNGLHA